MKLYPMFNMIYIILTLLSCFVLFSARKRFTNSAKTIISILALAGSWVLLDKIILIFLEEKLLLSTPKLRQIPLITEYSDDLVTTALSLLAVGLLAMKDRHKNISILYALIGLDLVMMICGIAAEYSQSEMRYLWFGIGCTPFVLILILLWNTLSKHAKAQTAALHRSYLKSISYLTLFWCFYPVFWWTGPMGIGLLSIEQVKTLYVILNIFTKPGFYLFMYIQLDHLQNKTREVVL